MQTPAGISWIQLVGAVGGIVGTLSSIVAVTMYVTLTRERVQRLTEHEQRMDSKLDAALKQLNEATVAMKLLGLQQTHLGDDGTLFRESLKSATFELQGLIGNMKAAAAEQNVINRVTNELLNSLTKKIDGLETRVNEASASVSLFGELLKMKGITQ